MAPGALAIFEVVIMALKGPSAATTTSANPCLDEAPPSTLTDAVAGH